MRRLVAAACAGIGGAVTLTLFNQLRRSIDRQSPPLDTLDNAALKHTLRRLHLRPRSPDRMRHLVRVSEFLVTSALYSSLFTPQPPPWVRGSVGGAIAGIAVALLGPALYASRAADKMGRPRAQALAIATYSSAGLVASALYSMLARQRFPALYTQSLPIDRAAL